MSLSPCQHRDIQVHVSLHASECGFIPIEGTKRDAARTPAGRLPAPRVQLGKTTTPGNRPTDPEPYTFPAPLTFENDDLALDPKYPPQSLRSWIREPERNKVTKERKTIYVAAPPTIGAGVSWMNDLLALGGKSRSKGTKRKREDDDIVSVPQVKTDDVIDYLRAFYHGMDVKPFPNRFDFISWDSTTVKGTAKTTKQPAQLQKYVGLRPGPKAPTTRIRVRPCPDKVFRAQLNLNDILDCVIEAVPEDAYSVLLMTDHDLHEDEDDDYCCGRAYGGSRAAVVSSARYHPSLDRVEGVDRQHMWPASHCKMYMCQVRGAFGAMKSPMWAVPGGGAMRAAIAAAKGTKLPKTPEELSGLWMSRVARTASHELGHCIGMDHCVYYACVMQGTAGMAEDGRQPPYLCPVCEAKMARAVGELNGKGFDEAGYAEERDGALQEVCAQHKSVGMFVGYEAWLANRWEGKEEP